jgi:hypothetical protein
MSTWKRFAALFTAAAATVTVVMVTTESASANETTNPTFVSQPFNWVLSAEANTVSASGAINLSRTPDSNCVYDGSRTRSVLSARVGTIASLTGLSSQCSVSGYGSTAYAESDAATVDLFGGRIKIKALRSICSWDAETGLATVGSTWGSFGTDQNYSRNGSGAIVIPNVATVAVNVKGVDYKTGQAYSNMLVVTLLNTAQTVVIGHCELNAYRNT